MHIKDYISEEGIVFASSVSSKKNALEILSEKLAEQDNSLVKSKILDGLLAREKLGSTGLEKGIAIPHCRLEELDSIHTAMLKLEEGIDFDASDDKPVTFFFCLVVPEEANEEHLQLLAGLAEQFDNEQVRNALNECKNAKCIYDLLSLDPKNLAA